MPPFVAASLSAFPASDMPGRKQDVPPFPVEDVDGARRWLWTYGKVHEWLDADPSDLPPVARLVCDVFWISPEHLLRDLRADWQRALAVPRRSFRDRVSSWGR